MSRRVTSNKVQRGIVGALAEQGTEALSTDTAPQVVETLLGRFNAFRRAQICSAGNEDTGRGQLLWDLYLKLTGKAFAAWSLKVTTEDRIPRSVCLFTGTDTAARIFETQVVDPESTSCLAFPLMAINWNPKSGEWHGMSVDVKALVREHGNVWPQATGKRGVPLVKSWARRPSGGGVFTYPPSHPKHGELMDKRHKWYLSGRVNCKPAGVQWVSLGVSDDNTPTAALLEWACAEMADSPVSGHFR